MLLPLYGFLAGDTLGVIVLVHENQTVHELAACLMQAASVRVAPFAPCRVRVHDRDLDPEMTVAEAGLTPLMRVDVVPLLTGSARDCGGWGSDDELHDA